MTSTVCHRFVQNAWKKERCSNCFKSKEEHVSLKREAPVSRRSLTTTITTAKPRGGIIKTTSSSRGRKCTVSFKPDLTEVIGYGGEDWSDGEESDHLEDTSTELSEDETPLNMEEDKELDKITKANTEMNANIAPAAPITTGTAIPAATTTDRRRTFTQLMLGQPLRDSEGKRQTLLVSVTPFGQDEPTERTPPRRITNKSVSHIPIAKNKEILVEARPKVVLTAYTKNRDSPDIPKTQKEHYDKKEIVEVENKLTREDCLGDEIKTQSDEDCEKNDIVETRNELNVLKKVDVSVSATERNTEDETSGENVKFEPIVKSELKVQLSCPSTQPREIEIKVEEIPKDVEEPAVESSSESSDSLGPAESREQAGEPDGRADPDVPCEPPALPRSPPPMLVAAPPRASFLHGGPPAPRIPTGAAVDKPKIPSKPDKVVQMVRKPTVELSPLPSPVIPPVLPQQLPQTPDPSKLPNKRRAPNPPPTPTPEDVPVNGVISDIFTQELIESPIVRSVSMPDPEALLAPTIPSGESPVGPEPAPRRTLSMSNDNLTVVDKVEEKRKDKSRTKFSLMKFLRGGSGGSKTTEKNKMEEFKEKIIPLPKPRLVIVHPLELNGSAVEVVNPPLGEDIQSVQLREGGPPAPPPRNFSEKRSEDPKPPPKSEELLRKQRQISTSPISAKNNGSSTDNVYANLGEVRSGLVPCKPQRTASMREREALLEQQSRRAQLQAKQEHVYERVTPPRRHSDESGVKEPNRFKAGVLSPSSYSGSEPDLEIYSPCGSYYGSECEVSEGGCSRPCRLRSRKGRSIVHRNLEDNYGAVVVANHEALAQVLEHLHLSPVIQPALRGLQSASVLRWSDFSIVDNSPSVVVGRRAFYHALWGAHHVTLSVSKDQGSMHKHPAGLGSFSLVPVTEFSDLVAAKYLPGHAPSSEPDLVQASVAVFSWMQVDTIQSISATLKTKNGAQMNANEVSRDACFILLQFVNSLKSLQAQGIEEVPLSLSNFILCHDVDKDNNHRLCLLQGLSEEVCRTDETEKFGSLCQSATTALDELFPATKLAMLIRTLLKKESAMSLSQVKSILEFSLWGPSDVALGVPIKDRELALQRWLDLERATVLHGLVGTRVQLSVLEECHLLFLVRSSAKMMCEASLLLESNGAT